MKMTTKRMWLLAAAVSVAAWSGAVYADGPAGSGAGDKGAPPAKDGALPPGANHPKMEEMVSPGASKEMDNDDLTKKLTGTEAAKDGDPMKQLKVVMDRMGQTQTKLEKDEDPGMATQELQTRIVFDLDTMIEMMKKTEPKNPPPPKPGESQGAQKKAESSGNSSGSGSGQQKPGGTNAATSDNISPGSPSAEQTNDANLHDGRKGWGDLPPRDRDLVANGSKEKFLPEYTDMIERYYEALAELNKSTKDR